MVVFGKNWVFFGEWFFLGRFALEGKAVKSPIFTPDGKFLIWLQRDAEGPHHSAMALMKAALPLSEKVRQKVKWDL